MPATLVIELRLFLRPDKHGIGIAWTSSNLNGPWFGGARWIPNTDDCKGNGWRKLIIDGLNQASVAACHA